jgi:hypothetical protein
MHLQQVQVTIDLLNQARRLGQLVQRADPELGGLELEARTATGETAADLAEIRQIRISVTARSHRPIPRARGPGYYRDSLYTVAYLRNGGRW